jgi:hypothetical protein
MSLIIPANSLAGGGYAVDNSLRFNSASSDYLSRTPASSGDRKTFTISFWVKRSILGTSQFVYNARSANASAIFFTTGDQLYFTVESGVIQLQTNRLFRDVSAWYHIVYEIDTTQGTASNRAKLYVNGVQETSFATATYPSVNADTRFNENIAHNIGRRLETGGDFFNGYLSEFYNIDGQALTPTDFGEFDADSGVWKPIAYSGTYGTNGFFLEFQSSGALGTDSSGNANTFTVNNLTSIDQTTDTPTNNFCTLNPLYKFFATNTYSEGNLKIVAGGSWSGALGTMAVSTGKWYWELKLSGSISNHYIGVQTINVDVSLINPFYRTGSLVFYNGGSGTIDRDGVSIGGTYGTFLSSDIVGMALDMGAGSYGQLTIYKNGVAIASNIDLSSTSNGAILPLFSTLSSTEEVNFGNAPYTISSGNADANGYGNFEYAVPTGYLSLCTKNLSEVNS